MFKRGTRLLYWASSQHHTLHSTSSSTLRYKCVHSASNHDPPHNKDPLTTKDFPAGPELHFSMSSSLWNKDYLTDKPVYNNSLGDSLQRFTVVYKYLVKNFRFWYFCLLIRVKINCYIYGNIVWSICVSLSFQVWRLTVISSPAGMGTVHSLLLSQEAKCIQASLLKPKTNKSSHIWWSEIHGLEVKIIIINSKIRTTRFHFNSLLIFHTKFGSKCNSL